MYSRRHFLFGMGAIALGQMTSGCSIRSNLNLKVRLLKNSIPPQLLKSFRKYRKKELEGRINLKFKAETQLAELFRCLEIWQKESQKKDTPNKLVLPLRRLVRLSPPATPDLVTLGDYWLTGAIQENLIQPIDVKQLPLWKKLPPRWQELVKRDEKGQLSKSGQVWGAPYRWGCTAIAYNRKKFEAEGWDLPQDWDDLWRPELGNRLSLLDSPREVIGLTLKKLGANYNSPNLEDVSKLKQELITLNKQVKLYSSDSYLQPLILEDTDIAVGWSTDFLSLKDTYPHIEVIIPASGTALWVDMWVRPKVTPSPKSSSEKEDTLPLWQEWLNFCWQPQAAQQISLFTPGSSPMVRTIAHSKLSQGIQDDPLVLPKESIWQESEFLLPLSSKTTQQYKDLWKRMREVKKASST